MITIRKPKVERIHQFLAGRQSHVLTYQDVGATATDPPADFVVDHTRLKLGEGERVFAAARSALENWCQFQLGWLEILPPDRPLQPGELIAVVARLLGVWWVNPCRIVYVIDEPQAPQKKFGFAYGTLSGHVGSGEERFLVEMDDRGSVWYDILAFSRPQNLLARIGYPYMRRVQKQFGKSSAAAMQQAIHKTLNAEPPI